MSLTSLDPESIFKLFLLGSTEHVNIGVSIYFDQGKQDFLGHSKHHLQSPVPRITRKKYLLEYLLPKFITKMDCLSPQYTHACFCHSHFPIKQVLTISGDHESILQVLIPQAFCWLSAHGCYRNFPLLRCFIPSCTPIIYWRSSYVNILQKTILCSSS